MSQTDIVNTCGDKTIVYSVMAEVTLLRYAFVLVKRNGLIWTYFNTRLTSGAFVIIHYHNAIASFINRFLRTSIRTWWIIAVSAHIYVKNEIQFAVN